jgi:hypothetical protein
VKGIVIGVHEWLYGCQRVTIQPEEAKDGKPAESFCIDEPQCTLLVAKAMEPRLPDQSKRQHGPSTAAMSRQADPRR